MNTYYEITDFKVESQKLSRDDVKLLLLNDMITPFTMVKRSTEADALPLLSHPDFEDSLEIEPQTTPSINLTVFLEKIEKTKTPEAKTPDTSDRRHQDLSVIITQGTKTFTGTLIDRTPRSLRLRTPSPGLKIGQEVHLLLISNNQKEKQKGLVKSFSERVDRRQKGALFYIYEITLMGIFL